MTTLAEAALGAPASLKGTRFKMFHWRFYFCDHRSADTKSDGIEKNLKCMIRKQV